MRSSQLLLFVSPRLKALSLPRPKLQTTCMFGSLPRLVDTDGTALSGDAVAERLGGKRAALYFAAGWCPMCTSFEPALLKFRRAASDSGKPVELIYVGSDRTEEDGASRASALGMMRIPFGDADGMKLKHRVWAGPESVEFGIGRRSGVPALVVLDGSGDEMAFLAVESEGVGALASWPLADERGLWN